MTLKENNYEEELRNKIEKELTYNDGGVDWNDPNSPKLLVPSAVANLFLSHLKEYKERVRERNNKALGHLNATLHEQCIDTQLITIKQWNAEIAPKLSELSMAIDEQGITARTYKLPENYFGDDLLSSDLLK